MAAADAVRLFAAYYDNPADPEQLIDRLGLRSVARTSWRRLSGGEQQRVSLALALVGRPEVVFLDEPTAGVDPQGRIVIRDVISELRASGVCVVLTTHELDEAERLADRIVIVDRGRVVADGTPQEITGEGAGTEIRFAAPAGLDTAALAAELRAAVVEEAPGEYRVARPGDPSTIAALTGWLARHDVPLGDLRAGRQRLEDVFLRLVSPADEPDPRPSGRRRGRRR
jgi:ABC-2 type transport system ATP-binding protein